MYTLLKPLLVRDTLLKRKLQTFSPWEFEKIFHISSQKTKYFLETQSTKGLFTRLKKGLYALKTDMPSEEEMANKLYRPSYISFEYALAFHNILPEMVYQITSATTKPTRIFTIENKVFNYFKIKKEAYTGYVLTKTENKSFLLAEPEKALVDYLYFVALGKKPQNNRLNVSQLDKKRLLSYAQLYQRTKLNKLIKNLL